jgi:oxalate decarboxylase
VGQSSAKEASVTQLPISKGLAGVSMTLGPGDMRELHWHATAAEWAIVTRGRVRTTVLGPGGFAETNEFEPGDVWYFPRGHGHMLECLGKESCHFMLIFDNGYFSEFGTFSITDWVGHTPKALLAKNFGVPQATFDNFPQREVYFAHGAPPPQRPAAAAARRPARAPAALAADAQVAAPRERPRRQQRGRKAVAGRFPAVPDLENHDRRGPGT